MELSRDTKIIGSIIGTVVTVLIIILAWGSLFETNSKTTYQIKQAAVSGTVTCREKPGVYWQGFGDIDTWNKAETIFYTKDNDADGDTNDDKAIEVRFNDGSICAIGSTMRVNMPSTKEGKMALVTKDAYTGFRQIEQKLILPSVRKVLRNTSALMSATESYKDKRTDFVNYVIDQIENGPYETVNEVRKVKDLVSGEMVEKNFKVIATDKNNNPLHSSNPLAGSGITLRNFEIKKFHYSNAVAKQIVEQQKALMAVQTAKANSAKAQQDTLTIAEQGKARVAKAQYLEKEKTAKEEEIAKRKKVVATINAQQKEAVAAVTKKTAEIAANQKKSVAKLDMQTAKLEKAAMILRGEGLAKANKLVVLAGATPTQKLDALVQMNKDMADSIARKPVPTNYTVLGGSGGGNSFDAQQSQLLNAMNTVMMDKIGVDLKSKRK